ncbi:hypothetical protein GCM10029992_02450 [Glycomyces albus]
MQERQVSVEGETYPLPRPFTVLATSNPVEFEGTYQLPEAQLDRFLLRVSFGYPNQEEEWEVLQRRLVRRREEVELAPVIDAQTLVKMQEALERVVVEDSVGRYMVAITAASRGHAQLQVGASPRGSLALLLASRALAVLNGRDFVTPDDVKGVAASALSHRITLRPELWMRRIDPAQVVDDICRAVEAPQTAQAPTYSQASQG